MTTSPWEDHFHQLANNLADQCDDGECFTLSLVAEDSQFTRFNRAQVRQTGTVVRGTLTLTWMAAERVASESMPFTADPAPDGAALAAAVQTLRSELPQLPADPYLVRPTGTNTSREVYGGSLLPVGAIAALMEPLQGLDAVGLYAGGTSVRAYADSAGQRHWFETQTFTQDYSLFAADGQAVKGTYAGRHWQTADYQKTLAISKDLLGQLAMPRKTLDRGHYRTYFAPAAVADLASMLSWGSLGEGAMRRGGSALGLLKQGEKTLCDRLTVTEDFSQGQVPRFNQYGELAPPVLPLIAAGKLVNTLVSARTAKEYSIPSTSAEGGEYLRSPVLAPGTLPTADVLAALDTGLYVSNLHYLNWSDRPQGRITGMTRYACFWVEKGAIVSPIENLRFDESLYNFWGPYLIDCTQETTLVPEVGSYGYRDLGGTQVPGMLVEKFAYTL
ncbi:MAG: metallopeptidase TldD-related protein [Cyanobacteria bacterium]|nr:metallopeptidase TldD-related protein [Cyanobacteriota bacterium]